MFWQNYGEVHTEYSEWRKAGRYAQSDIDRILWWFYVIVRLLFVLIEKMSEPVQTAPKD